MISKEILKKHNLKAVPFACIGEGETFIGEECISDLAGFPLAFYFRRLCDGYTPWADETADLCHVVAELYNDDTVYIPVWRVTN